MMLIVAAQMPDLLQTATTYIKRPDAMIKYFSNLFTLIGLSLLTACSGNPRGWDEEVKLLDGRVIVVTQKRLLQNDILTRDAWLTIRLPELSDKPIEWHEALDPMVVNVFDKHLYIVALPPTDRENERYGNPKPSYIGYRWNGKVWERIAFSDIPEAIYDANMLVNDPPDRSVRLLTLSQKNSEKMNGSLKLLSRNLRISPNEYFFN